MTSSWELGVDVGRASGRRDERRLPARAVADVVTNAAHRRVRIRVMGPLTVQRGDWARTGRDLGAVKTRGLLELLLLSRGRPVSKDELIHTLWDGKRNLPSDPTRTLEHYVCVVRAALTDDRALSHDVLVTGTNSYLLDDTYLDVDVDHFDQLLRDVAHASGDERRALLDDAAAMASGDLFQDSPNLSWAQSERASHRESVAWVHLLQAEDALVDESLHRAVWSAEQALRFTPYSEHAFRLLMVAHLGLGSRELARLTYRRCVNTLWRGLRLDPTAHTTLVATAIASGAGLDELLTLLAPAAAA